jgi:hypothetical protein
MIVLVTTSIVFVLKLDALTRASFSFSLDWNPTFSHYPLQLHPPTEIKMPYSYVGAWEVNPQIRSPLALGNANVNVVARPVPGLGVHKVAFPPASASMSGPAPVSIHASTP